MINRAILNKVGKDFKNSLTKKDKKLKDMKKAIAALEQKRKDHINEQELLDVA